MQETKYALVVVLQQVRLIVVVAMVEKNRCVSQVVAGDGRILRTVIPALTENRKYSSMVHRRCKSRWLIELQV